jgi:hypothetical protein
MKGHSSRLYRYTNDSKKILGNLYTNTSDNLDVSQQRKFQIQMVFFGKFYQIFKKEIQLGMVVHACNLSCSGSRSKRIMLEDQPEQTCKTLSKSNEIKRAGGVAQVV